jgi:hypothetical protein
MNLRISGSPKAVKRIADVSGHECGTYLPKVKSRNTSPRFSDCSDCAQCADSACKRHEKSQLSHRVPATNILRPIKGSTHDMTARFARPAVKSPGCSGTLSDTPRSRAIDLRNDSATRLRPPSKHGRQHVANPASFLSTLPKPPFGVAGGTRLLADFPLAAKLLADFSD